MVKILLALFATLVTFTLTISTNTKEDADNKGEKIMSHMDSVTPSDNHDNSTVKSELDMEYLMSMCNESYRIEMDNLKSLNETGSFFDETDKTPKCFIRCMLQNTGILLENGQIDSAQAAVVFAGERNGISMDDLGNFTASCASDRQEKCLCEKSYNFLKCVMSLEIVNFGMVRY